MCNQKVVEGISMLLALFQQQQTYHQRQSININACREIISNSLTLHGMLLLRELVQLGIGQWTIGAYQVIDDLQTGQDVLLLSHGSIQSL